MENKTVIGAENGSHLNITRYGDGTVDMKWNWEALERDVQIATGDRQVHYVDVGDLPPDEAMALVKEVKTKVAKKRTKKAK